MSNSNNTPMVSQQRQFVVCPHCNGDGVMDANCLEQIHPPCDYCDRKGVLEYVGEPDGTIHVLQPGQQNSLFFGLNNDRSSFQRVDASRYHTLEGYRSKYCQMISSKM